MSKLPSQKEVVAKTAEIMKEVNKEEQTSFIFKNYKILEKKNHNSRMECIIISNAEDENGKGFFYKPPEDIALYVEQIAFYMALEQLGVPPNMW